MKKKYKTIIAVLLFLLLFCGVSVFAASVELDTDHNGAMDVGRGGTNSTTSVGARANLGLGNVDNTHDMDKPISTAVQNALNTKVHSIQPGTNVTIDNSDPLNPVVNATGGGDGGSVDLSSPSEIGGTLPAPAHFTYLQCDSLDINPPPAGSTGEFTAHEDVDSPGDDVVGFKAPVDVNLGGAQAGDLLWVLPEHDGQTGQVMATDGMQTLSWMTPLKMENNLADVDNVQSARAALGVPSIAYVDTKQNVITGTCNVGEVISAINSDGSVVCRPLPFKEHPAYSNDPCTPGFYAFNAQNHYTYMCVSANHWDYRDATGAWIIWNAPNPVITINTDENNYYTLDGSHTIGQTWTIPAGGDGDLNSVIFMADTVNTAGTVTCRASTTSGQIDLSSNYIEGSFDVTTAGEFEVVFSSTATISEGDVVSVACHASSGTSIRIGFQSSDVYAGGMKYATGAVTWDLTNHEDAAQDFYFKYSRP